MFRVLRIRSTRISKSPFSKFGTQSNKRTEATARFSTRDTRDTYFPRVKVRAIAERQIIRPNTRVSAMELSQ